MHNFSELLNFNTLEEGQKNLDKAVEIRDMMGGELYWNIANDDCNEIFNKLVDLKVKFLKIKEKLDGISIKVIQFYLRIKKIEYLESSLNSNDNRCFGYYILDTIEFKYIENFYNKIDINIWKI